MKFKGWSNQSSVKFLMNQIENYIEDSYNLLILVINQSSNQKSIELYTFEAFQSKLYNLFSFY